MVAKRYLCPASGAPRAAAGACGTIPVIRPFLRGPERYRSSHAFGLSPTRPGRIKRSPRREQRHLRTHQASIEVIVLELYVGNLPWSIDDAGLSGLFAAFGNVERAKV